MDGTPFGAPQYEQSTVSDLPGRKNRRLDFEEQEEMIPLINKNSKLKTRDNSTFRKLQPKRQHIDVDTKVLTRSCLDRVYETASMKEQAGEDIKKESRRLEKTSGSKDSPNYQDDPGATHEPKGKRGRPSKSKHEKQMDKYGKQIEQRKMGQEGSNLHTTEIAALLNKHLKTIVSEYNKRTGSQVIIKKDTHI